MSQEILVVDQTWDRVRQRLQGHVSARSFDTWINPIAVLSTAADELTLGVPSTFFLDWIEEHYRHLLEECVASVVGNAVRLRFVVNDAAEVETVVPERPTPPPAPPQRLPTTHNRHTFEHFVVGSSNEFACAAALAVVEQPGLLYNPLFIYGGVGLGKTHMLHAISHKIAERNPEARLCYLTSEKFMLEMIRSIQRGSTMDFKRKYRSVDVLMIDDIQFLSGKESTQEEFFHTFNTLYDAQKQIVITADCPPKEITGLAERLISRVSWGLVADIQTPDFETRVAILRKFAELKQIDLRDDVALLIATNVRTNIRDLEGCLNRLHALAARAGRRIDVEFAERTLGDLFRGHHQAISPTRILQVVSSIFEVKPEVLISKKRTKAIALPRQIAMYFMRTHTSLSLAEIGRKVGDRDHSTVIHAVDKIERMKNESIELRAQMAKVARDLGVEIAS